MTLRTVRDAATELGVGYSTLKQWIYQGRVRTTQTQGGHHRISDAEIDRLQARRPDTRRPTAKNRRPAEASDVLAVLSARNQFRGFVEEIRTDGLMGQVRLRIGDLTLTAVITSDAIRALKLRRGDDALAVIKSTEVMIARPPSSPSRSPKKRKR